MMFEEQVKRLRERAAWINFPHHGEESPTEDAKLMMEAADAIEELSKLAEAIPHKCKCCIGCEIEQKNGGCETGFVLSPERAKAHIEENLDWWRKFRALMEAMGTPIELPKEMVTDSNQLIGDSEQLGEPVNNPYKLEEET